MSNASVGKNTILMTCLMISKKIIIALRRTRSRKFLNIIVRLF